jgi:hypothetical protein
MVIPWRSFSVTSFVAAYLLVSRHSEWTKLGFAGAFASLWLAQGFAWSTWKVLIYPKFFSPLRGLPEPDNNSFLMGQFGRIRADPTGVPHREWYEEIDWSSSQPQYTALTSL